MEKVAITAPTVNKQKYLIRSKGALERVGRTLARRNTIVEIISALLIILFIYTGINKIIDYEKFKFEMGRSPFIQNMNGFIAATLPSGEILLSILLIFNRTRLLGLYISLFIMSLFTGYIWVMLKESYYLPCSCGGILEAMTWEDHLLFNAVFTLMTALGIVLQSKINQDFTPPKKVMRQKK